MHPVDHAVEDLAALQRGRFTRDQVRSIAANPRSIIHSRLRSGRWRRLTTRVLCLPGAPTDPLGQLWTAHLHVGTDSVVGRESAALLRGLPAVVPTVPILLVPDGSHRRLTGARIHQVGDLLPSHHDLVGGLPVTTIERTIVDLAIAGASVARVDTWLHHLAAERSLRPAALAATAEELRRHGKRRPASLVQALARRLPGRGVEQSRLETALTAALRGAGIGTGTAQFTHPGSPDSTELVDRAFPEAMLLVEADGRLWHSREAAFTRDRRRDREAARAGWLTVRYTFAELVGAPGQVGDELAEIHASRHRSVANLGGRGDAS